MFPIASTNLQQGTMAPKSGKTKQQNNVGEESKANKYQLHVPRRLCISHLEVYERSHIPGVLLIPMHIPKAPPKKIRKHEGALTTMVP